MNNYWDPSKFVIERKDFVCFYSRAQKFRVLWRVLYFFVFLLQFTPFLRLLLINANLLLSIKESNRSVKNWITDIKVFVVHATKGLTYKTCWQIRAVTPAAREIWRRFRWQLMNISFKANSVSLHFRQVTWRWATSGYFGAYLCHDRAEKHSYVGPGEKV